MHRSAAPLAARAKERPAPAGGNALVTFDAQLAKQQEKAELDRIRGPTQHVAEYTGPKVKWEETGLYKAMVRTQDIEEELTRIRNLIRKRTDPTYEPDDDDFNVAPARKFDAKVDYYKLLDVEDFATAKDIKGAYRKLALQYHPDKNRDKKPEQLRHMQEEFEKIHAAYEVLSDRATRRQYDRAKFDEARAKSQGMGSSMFSQKTNTDGNFWGRWSARKAQEGSSGTPLPCGKPAKVPKAPDLVVEVRISLEKALRGGLKIREVRRDRMQRAFGAASKAAKPVHVQVEPGQADGSEYRLEGDGNWPSLNHTPGDLVFRFKHKPHAHLRQSDQSGEGHLQLVAPLTMRAKATEHVLSVWSPTFKGQMVLLRFLNPLLSCAPSRSCDVRFRVEQEGLPVTGDTNRRGALSITVHVELEGEALVPSWGSCEGGSALPCQDTLLRRHLRQFNHRPQLRLDLARCAAGGSAQVRWHTGAGARGRGGEQVHLPAVLTVWEAPPGTDLVQFAKAAAALGWQAQRDPERYCLCYLGGLVRRRLKPAGHVTLQDDELASDDEAAVGDRQLARPDGVQEYVREARPPSSRKRGQRKPRQRSEVESFLLAFDLGPPDGLPDPGSTTDEGEEDNCTVGTIDGEVQTLQKAVLREQPPVLKPSASFVPRVAVPLHETEQETLEEKELTALIRRRQSDIEQARRKWSNRKQRLKGEREEEEGTLRELLEKDKQREHERIEREMNGLRGNFEYQVNAEKRWMDEFRRDARHRHEWVCVFKPAMVARTRPSEDAPVAKRILLDEVVKAKGEPTEDHWIQLEGSTGWALTWHPKHGRLLQQWYGVDQAKFLDLTQKIEERRKIRNQTFAEYARKKKEVEEWSIPPGPTLEEVYEIEDEEGEQLAGMLEPLLKELREYKRKLRDLRQRRLEASAERARRESEGGVLGQGVLPKGFRLHEEPEPRDPERALAASSSPTTGALGSADGPREWEQTKQAADRAAKERDWHTALKLYGQALQQGGEALSSVITATLLSNRALARSKLDDWAGSLEDAASATACESSWPRGWLRRATAELRLNRARQALGSLKRGLSCAGLLAAQFLPLVTECEAALYSDKDDEAPDSASARIERFKSDGTTCFGQGAFGMAVLCYTRALYHRSMMEGTDEAIILSNRSAAFLKLGLASEALSDALASSERDSRWAKPLVRAGQAALILGDFKAAYQYYAKARRLDGNYKTAAEGLNDCLQRIIRWDYPAAVLRWARFGADRQRPREGTRIWALSDVFFDQHGVPEWCKSLSNSFFRDDVLLVAGNLADSLSQLRFALTVLKSKFRRVLYIPGNHDLWVRRVTIKSILKGERVQDEQREMVDSVSKLLEVLQVCDELGVETSPAEVAAGIFVVPMFSWYSRDFIQRDLRRQKASETDAETKITIDQWVQWPFPCGSDDAWKFFMRMNEPALRAVLASKATFERFSTEKAVVITMTHFLTRNELDIDWTIPGIWDYVGCDGLDEQIRAIGANVHVYGRACVGPQKRVLDGLVYVHNYVGSTEKHRPGMAPFCVYDRGQVIPQKQPTQEEGFKFQPLERPPEPVRSSGFGRG